MISRTRGHAGPKKLMNTTDALFNIYDYFLAGERWPGRSRGCAIEFRDRAISYDELRDYADLWAGRMVSAGVNEGDRVALLLFDSPEFIAAFLAVASIGAVSVPINTFLQAEEIAFIVRDAGARVIVGESDLEQRLAACREERRLLFVDSNTRQAIGASETTGAERRRRATTETSPAFLLYTSGSTGAPKGVLHLHRSIPATVESYAKTVLGLTAADRVYSASRLYFAYGLGNSLSFPLAAGATVVLDDQRPTPDRVTKLLEQHKPTVFFGVPSLYSALLELKSRGVTVDTSSLRLCISAGEALPDRVFDEWKREFGLSILDGIGSTEMLHIFVSNHPGDERPGSSGKTVEGYEARLLDDAGNELAGEQTGNLWVKGESATAGYWNRPDLTEAAVRGGWVKTGDVYRRDSQDRFYHLGRSDDCFKVNGLWVSPVEVESALLAHADVLEAAVIPGVDARGLATAHAFTVIREGCERNELARELLEHARGRLAHYKVPSRIDFIKEMPRTSTGKVQRFKLKAEKRE